MPRATTSSRQGQQSATFDARVLHKPRQSGDQRHHPCVANGVPLTPAALFVHGMTLVLQGLCQLLDTAKRDVQKLLFDQAREFKVRRGLALRRIIQRRSRDRQQAAPRLDQQLWVLPFDHSTPHLPVQGLNCLTKKTGSDG
jgi:hypothetical protein